jgi:hypothetical protein
MTLQRVFLKPHMANWANMHPGGMPCRGSVPPGDMQLVVQSYGGRISGPLLARIDVHVESLDRELWSWPAAALPRGVPHRR